MWGMNVQGSRDRQFLLTWINDLVIAWPGLCQCIKGVVGVMRASSGLWTYRDPYLTLISALPRCLSFMQATRYPGMTCLIPSCSCSMLACTGSILLHLQNPLITCINSTQVWLNAQSCPVHWHHLHRTPIYFWTCSKFWSITWKAEKLYQVTYRFAVSLARATHVPAACFMCR